ncbi:UNVERIFIED_CONTAM: hypothetical protein GTU68_038104 [Idotea baltica]|nr:hypothetical protein [Idotea baltica]
MRCARCDWRSIAHFAHNALSHFSACLFFKKLATLSQHAVKKQMVWTHINRMGTQ